MEVFIFDQENRRLTGVAEAFEYLRWTRRYSFCGSFELLAIATTENMNLLKEGNIIQKSDDEEAGIIERVELSQTDREMITVSGRFASSMLGRRIVWDTETLSGDISTCVQKLLENNMLNPGEADRRIMGFAYTAPHFGVNVPSQISYKNLLEAVSGICDTAGIGIKTVFDPDTGLFTVRLYAGEVSSALFSNEYENVTEQTYIQSVDEYANTALIGGEGEGAGRVFVTIIQGTGENRREVFVDARDLQSESFPGSYTDALLFRGQSRLSELAPRYNFDAGLNLHGNLRYKTDFDLGSVVQVISSPWGVAMTTRITEAEETYDSEGMSLMLTFGKAELTLAQKMRSDISGMKTTLLAPPLPTEIPDGSVTAAKLASRAVTGEKIAAGAVGTAGIADNAVTSGKIPDNAIISAKIAANAVTGVKIADGNVTGSKIADGHVTTAKITDGNVTGSKIASLTITAGNIASGAVTTAKMAQEADTYITISWASGVSLAATNNSYVNKGVVNLGFQILLSTTVSPGGTLFTITNTNFRPYTTVRSVLIPVPTFVTNAPITIESNGVVRNAASGTTLPTGYYMVCVTYARA